MEKTQSVAQSVIFRSQFLAIFVERSPRSFQSVFDLCSFLIFERDFFARDIAHFHLLPRFRNFDVVDRDLFRLHFVLVTDYFRLVWVDSQTHCFRAGLEFT